MQQETIAAHRALNALKPIRPMVMIDQVCWHEMNVGDELTLDFMDSEKEIRPQHYAFLVNDREFDAGLARLKKDGIKLDIRSAPGIGSFTADQRRLRQILFDLLSNAVGFSPPGETVTLSAERRADTVVFSVADHGPGIPAESMDKVFEWFETDSMGSHHRGVGLEDRERLLLHETSPLLLRGRLAAAPTAALLWGCAWVLPCALKLLLSQDSERRLKRLVVLFRLEQDLAEGEIIVVIGPQLDGPAGGRFDGDERGGQCLPAL